VHSQDNTMEYQDIAVDLSSRRLRLKGPAAFMAAIEWGAVEAEALSLCPAMSPEDAVREAVWRHYAAWWEREHRGSDEEPCSDLPPARRP
jgi:hypothetical protein